MFLFHNGPKHRPPHTITPLQSVVRCSVLSLEKPNLQSRRRDIRHGDAKDAALADTFFYVFLFDFSGWRIPTVSRPAWDLHNIHWISAQRDQYRVPLNLIEIQKHNNSAHTSVIFNGIECRYEWKWRTYFLHFTSQTWPGDLRLMFWCFIKGSNIMTFCCINQGSCILHNAGKYA